MDTIQYMLDALRALVREGYTCARAQHWNTVAGRYQRLFGFADLLAIQPEEQGVLAVRCTTAEQRKAHLAKVRKLGAARLWVACGNRLEVWSFGQPDKKGNRAAERCALAAEDFFLPQ
jgi:hypothetical protein